MGKPKAQYVQAPTPPEMQGVRRNLGNFLEQYGTQMRGNYPGQINAPVNPYLALAGNMLAGMYSAGQPAGLGATNSILAQMLGLNQTPAMYNPAALGGMEWNWPINPNTNPAQMTSPQQQTTQKKEEEKRGPKIFAVNAR